MKNKAAVERWQRSKVLIIDEISMIDAELFETLDLIARTTRDTYLPFGGIQLILVGDFMQLPPVKKHPETRQPMFCFHSQVWDAAALNIRKGTIHLKVVERQKDELFVRYLNQVRLGLLTPEFLKLLDSCSVDTKPKPTNGIVPTKLYSLNKEIDNENNARLAELPGESVILTADDKWKSKPMQSGTSTYFRSALDNMIPETIEMKVGAQVMLLRNRSKMTYSAGGLTGGAGWSTASSALVNGSRGKVVSFTESVLRPGTMVPTVQFDNGMTVTIGPVEYTYRGPGGDGEMVRSQIPLKLAW